jgi:hypothetical protein
MYEFGILVNDLLICLLKPRYCVDQYQIPPSPLFVFLRFWILVTRANIIVKSHLNHLYGKAMNKDYCIFSFHACQMMLN